MQIAIRADASIALGSGHIMRCLTLAGALRAAGATVSFVCRSLPGDAADYIEAQGYAVARLCAGEADAFDETADAAATAAALAGATPLDWLIVDHYGIGAQWERALRPHTRCIMAIDDLADRSHDCDLLLDQNLYPAMKQRYQQLTPPSCRRLLGPRYALLRPQFQQAADGLRSQGRLLRDGNVRRMLVFFGGSDAGGETLVALRALQSLQLHDVAVDVVVGAANPQRDAVAQLTRARPGATFHCQVEDMAALMARADLALGAGGSATWERCSLGLPALAVAIAENQRAILDAAEAAGVLAQLSLAAHDQAAWSRAVRSLLAQPSGLQEQSRRSLKMMGVSLVFGESAAGGAPAVAAIMAGLAHERESVVVPGAAVS